MSLLQQITLNTDSNLDDSTYMNYNYFILDASSNSFRIDLRNITCDGMIFTFIRIDTSANTIKVVPALGQAINTGGAIAFPININTQFVSSGANWIAPYQSFTF